MSPWNSVFEKPELGGVAVGVMDSVMLFFVFSLVDLQWGLFLHVLLPHTFVHLLVPVPVVRAFLGGSERGRTVSKAASRNTGALTEELVLVVPGPLLLTAHDWLERRSLHPGPSSCVCSLQPISSRLRTRLV